MTTLSVVIVLAEWSREKPWPCPLDFHTIKMNSNWRSILIASVCVSTITLTAVFMVFVFHNPEVPPVCGSREA